MYIRTVLMFMLFISGASVLTHIPNSGRLTFALFGSNGVVLVSRLAGDQFTPVIMYVSAAASVPFALRLRTVSCRPLIITSLGPGPEVSTGSTVKLFACTSAQPG